MQALKAAVIFMGVLLIGGVTVLVYLIATGAGKRAGEADAPTPAPSAAPTALSAEPMSAPASVALKQGERLVAMRPDGARLYLHLDGPGGARILILNAESGAPLGEIALSAP